MMDDESDFELLICHQCGRDYPDHFPACPHCGAEKATLHEKRTNRSLKRWLLGLVVLLLFLAVALG